MSASSERYTETDSESDWSAESLNTTISISTSTYIDSITGWSRMAISDQEERKESGTSESESEDGSSFDMMDSGSSTGLQSISTPTTPSSMSAEEAKSSIDAFFTDTQEYTLKQENKLRFWQALCIEFGLVDLGPDHAPLAQKLEVKHHASDIDIDVETWAASVIESITDIDRITTDGNSLASNFTKKRKSKKARNLPPLPTTLTQAKNLLMRRAHVNLWDYMAAREPDMPDPKSNQEKVIGGPPKDYAYLVWPNQKALVEYTLRTRKIVSKDQAKEEWLQPVLKDICKLQLKYGLALRVAEDV